MRGLRVVIAAGMLMGTCTIAAAQQPPPQTPSTAPGQARTFTAPVGMILTTVRPERVADFEKLLAYVQEALAKATDPQVQAQAKGWRWLKAAEAGPNNTVVYVFEFNPTVTSADYGLFRILADAYPDTQLRELYRIYTASVTSGGSLLNLTPLTLPAPEPLRPTTPSSSTPPSDRQTPPINANPNVPPGR